MRRKRPAQLPGGQGTGVQPETVAIRLRGESMREYPRQVLRGDSNAIVGYFHADRALAIPPDADGDPALCLRALDAGALGVLKEIDEDLEDLVLVNEEGRHFFEFTDDSDVVAIIGRLIHLEGVFHQFGCQRRFHDAKPVRVGLLHGHDFLDVFDIPGQGAQFFEQCRPFRGQLAR